jgi:general secretion pathway protein E
VTDNAANAVATSAPGAARSQATGEPTQNAAAPQLRLLGQMLLDRDLIGQDDLDRALAFQQQFSGRLGAILIRLGAISEDALLPVLAEQLRLSVFEPDHLPIDNRPLLELIERSGASEDWWLTEEVVAWESADGAIEWVARDPLSPTLHEFFATAFPDAVMRLGLARNQDLDRLLDLIARSGNRQVDGDDISHLRELAEEAPVIEVVNNMFSQAMDQGASDIHVEPEERTFSIRLRVDGVLHTRLTLPSERYPAVASRIKLISGMDIAERRLPQDGRISTRVSGQEIDVRVSAVPGVHGESIVMRILPKERQSFRLENLGFAPDHLEMFRNWASEPHGIVLVTGPTGSGKSTTLYGTLEAINNRNNKIITVEDPVEYQLEGVTQIQAHAEIDYTFARALRAILRQDPDVIMIGEIRDLETAAIAVQAALTGHLVFSTLHTNDAISAFTRLIDMGVEPFMVATSVRAVQAQRLVRRLCPDCAQPSTPLDAVEEVMQRLRVQLNISGEEHWLRASGCKLCQGTGYRGRLGIYELVDLTADLQREVIAGKTTEELWEVARSQGARSLREDGLLKASRGLTSIEEIARVTGGAVNVDADPEVEV